MLLAPALVGNSVPFRLYLLGVNLMADLIFFAGVFQTSWPIPGVLDPLDEDTLFTASNLAEKERVSILCRTLTLFIFPNLAASAIRI